MRRAMTCVYWDPKSRMTICSFIGNEGEVSARGRGILREKNGGSRPIQNGGDTFTLSSDLQREDVVWFSGFPPSVTSARLSLRLWRRRKQSSSRTAVPAVSAG